MNSNSRICQSQGRTYQSLFEKIPHGKFMWIFAPIIMILGLIGFCLDIVIYLIKLCFKNKTPFNAELYEIFFSFAEYIVYPL